MIQCIVSEFPGLAARLPQSCRESPMLHQTQNLPRGGVCCLAGEGGRAMDIIALLINKTLMMLLLSGVGFVLCRRGKITVEGNLVLCNILILAALPCMLLRCFLVERRPEYDMALAMSALGALAYFVIAVGMSRLLFKGDPEGENAVIFPNAGFFGFPLITAMFNKEALFYLAPFIAVMNIIQWSYGPYIFTGDAGSFKIRDQFKKPFVIAIIAGFIIYFLDIRLPDFIYSAIDIGADFTTPLSMIIVGVYMSKCRLRELFADVRLYKVCGARLILMPLLSIAAFSLLPGTGYVFRCALLIAAACPVGTNVAVSAQLYGGDYAYAVRTVAMSTLLCVLTLPFLTYFASLVWA